MKSASTLLPFTMYWSRPSKPTPELSGFYDPVKQLWSESSATASSTFSRTGTTNFGKDPDEDRDD